MSSAPFYVHEGGKLGKRGRAKLEVVPKGESNKEMNLCVPDWKMENDPRHLLHLLPTSSNIGQDDNMIELMWKNGHVVLHNQTYSISPPSIVESKQPQKIEHASKCGGSLGSTMNLIQVDETSSWFPNPLDDSVESDFHDFFYRMRTPDSNVIDKENEGERCVKFGSTKDTDACTMRSSLHPQNRREEMGRETSHFGEVASGNDTMASIGESSSMLAIESSICGSSQYQNNSTNAGVMEKSLPGADKNSRREIVLDPVISSPSGGSGSSLVKAGPQLMTNHDHKRKGRDADEPEHHTKNAEQVSPEDNKLAQKTAPSRRSRAAEVHNLSERRRRDKINEKMKALQDLIPYCNKPDKASMLDEAIEYLKSLQLQVQIMWMGGGMAPMVFPGYMPHVGNGMGHPSLHSIPNPVQLPGTTLYNQFMPPITSPSRPLVCPSPAIPSLNFPNPMPNIRFPGPLPPYFGFPRMHLPTQVMDMYTYGSQVMQHNQTAASSYMPPLGTSSENIQSG